MNFTTKSFEIDGDLSLALVDYRVTNLMQKCLKNLNIQIIRSRENKQVHKSINYHPDMSVLNLGNGNIIVEPSLYEGYKELLDKYDFNIIKGESYLTDKYPYDIAYNVAIVGNYAIHNFKYTDKKILDFIEENELEKINIEQGYSKCSICIVDDKSIITSDKGIYNTLKDKNIDCLLIKEGHISLAGMNYGFIGGCSGMVSKDIIAFFGDITKHPDYENINQFVKSKKKNIISLSSEELMDFGSIVPLMTY
ncbi:MAG: hypothetical protein LBR30_07075 [Clostridioides sp.]|jgi:hypothetical protein|nr:hypothetical protein [Clostridioides sp.]